MGYNKWTNCARRQVTNTGPQALTLLNSDTVLHYAQSFAGRLLFDNPNIRRFTTNVVMSRDKVGSVVPV